VATFRYATADVFTDTPLTGNQLAVFTDARAIPEDSLQAIAREMNFSETVFVYPPAGQGHVRVRIFTPALELPFAGQLGVIVIETPAGPVPVELEREGAKIVFGRMTQPIPTWRPFEREADLLRALGVERSELPVEVYDLGPTHVYVVLGSREEVANLDPDLPALAKLEVGANCVAGSGTRWKTRMFAPFHGVDEDPATGSAAGPLAIHLARHGRIAFGVEIEIEQGAEIQRPSKLFARVDGSAENIERVEVGGSAVLVARGDFQI